MWVRGACDSRGLFLPGSACMDSTSVIYAHRSLVSMETCSFDVRLSSRFELHRNTHYRLHKGGCPSDALPLTPFMSFLISSFTVSTALTHVLNGVCISPLTRNTACSFDVFSSCMVFTYHPLFAKYGGLGLYLVLCLGFSRVKS